MAPIHLAFDGFSAVLNGVQWPPDRTERIGLVPAGKGVALSMGPLSEGTFAELVVALRVAWRRIDFKGQPAGWGASYRASCRRLQDAREDAKIVFGLFTTLYLANSATLGGLSLSGLILVWWQEVGREKEQLVLCSAGDLASLRPEGRILVCACCEDVLQAPSVPKSVRSALGRLEESANEVMLLRRKAQQRENKRKYYGRFPQSASTTDLEGAPAAKGTRAQTPIIADGAAGPGDSVPAGDNVPAGDGVPPASGDAVVSSTAASADGSAGVGGSSAIVLADASARPDSQETSPLGSCGYLLEASAFDMVHRWWCHVGTGTAVLPPIALASLESFAPNYRQILWLYPEQKCEPPKVPNSEIRDASLLLCLAEARQFFQLGFAAEHVKDIFAARCVFQYGGWHVDFDILWLGTPLPRGLWLHAEPERCTGRHMVMNSLRCLHSETEASLVNLAIMGGPRGSVVWKHVSEALMKARGHAKLWMANTRAAWTSLEKSGVGHLRQHPSRVSPLPRWLKCWNTDNDTLNSGYLVPSMSRILKESITLQLWEKKWPDKLTKEVLNFGKTSVQTRRGTLSCTQAGALVHKCTQVQAAILSRLPCAIAILGDASFATQVVSTALAFAKKVMHDVSLKDEPALIAALLCLALRFAGCTPTSAMVDSRSHLITACGANHESVKRTEILVMNSMGRSEGASAR